MYNWLHTETRSNGCHFTNFQYIILNQNYCILMHISPWMNSVLLYVRPKLFHEISFMDDKYSSGIYLMHEPLRTYSRVFVHGVERSSFTLNEFVLVGSINEMATLLQIKLGAKLDRSYYQAQWWPCLVTYTCITRCINSLVPSDAYMHQ